MHSDKIQTSNLSFKDDKRIRLNFINYDLSYYLTCTLECFF